MRAVNRNWNFQQSQQLDGDTPLMPIFDDLARSVPIVDLLHFHSLEREDTSSSPALFAQ